MEDFHYSKVTINSHSAKALITTKTPVFIFFFNDPKPSSVYFSVLLIVGRMQSIIRLRFDNNFSFCLKVLQFTVKFPLNFYSALKSLITTCTAV